MGNYNPAESKNKPTVAETLRAAEEDHYLDCPNAELRIRGAALLLDIILVSLAVSGLQNACMAVQAHLSHLDASNTESILTNMESVRLFLSLNAPMVAAYLFISLRLAFLYFYFIWSLAFAGGSPGKLILGLRVVQNRRGNFPSLPHSLSRELLKVFGIGLGGIGILYFFIGKKQGVLHDVICETSVKRIHGRL